MKHRRYRHIYRRIKSKPSEFKLIDLDCMLFDCSIVLMDWHVVVVLTIRINITD